MTNTNKSIATLHDLLDYDARKFTIAEIQLKKSLPAWIAAAGSLDLKTVLLKYLEFVEDHIRKMETFIAAEEITSINIDNKIIRAFLEDTAEKMSACSDVEVKDACLLASIQLINHFKISMYGTAASFAKIAGAEHFSNLFYEAEQEEKQIDERLSALAAKGLNQHAASPFSIKTDGEAVK